MEANWTIEETPAQANDSRRNSLSRVLPLSFTLLSLLAVAAANSIWLPVGVQAAGHGFTNIVGQDVRWNMFSADPRGIDLDLWATIEHVDGTTSTWSVDRRVLGGDLQYYRFVQWAESAVLLAPEDALTGLAGWLAAESSKPVARITIFGSQRDPVEPGKVRPEPHVEILADIDSSALNELEDESA
jgi:hypothetical protein